MVSLCSNLLFYDYVNALNLATGMFDSRQATNLKL
jgi:hypothetical protein